MNRQENIKKVYEQAKLDTMIKKDKAVLKKMKEIYLQESKAGQKTVELSIRRIIMKNQITKLAVSAVVIAAALLVFFYTGTKNVYALDQTIEAMQKVTTVHCFIHTFTSDKIELWVEVNPKTGANEKIRSENSEETRVTTPNESYVYEKDTNTFKHIKGSLDRMDIRLGRFIEDMVGIAKAMNADIKITDEMNGNKKVIIVVLETNQLTLESMVDPKTKLPVSMQITPKGELQPGQLGQSIEDITYNEPLPEGIFDFKIPQGATVEEQ
jgi:outer membrane lipoprotein-sorting protein